MNSAQIGSIKGGEKVIDNQPFERKRPSDTREAGLDPGSTPGTSTQVCPVCGEPVGNEHPNADVYHLACIMEITKHLREKR